MARRTVRNALVETAGKSIFVFIKCVVATGVMGGAPGITVLVPGKESCLADCGTLFVGGTRPLGWKNLASLAKDEDHHSAVDGVSKVTFASQCCFVFIHEGLLKARLIFSAEKEQWIEAAAALHVAFQVGARTLSQEVGGFIELQITAEKIHVFEKKLLPLARII